MCSINVWGWWRVPTRSSLHILLSLMQFKQHRSVQWKDILHVTGRLSCLDSSLEGLIASRWISAINQFFWIQPSFIYLMCPSSHTPDQWQRERPLFPAWKFKLHCHDEGVNSNHYANHQFLNRTFQELSLVLGIPTTIVIRQSWQKQQKHCLSATIVLIHCLVQLIKRIELNNPHHQQHGHKLQTNPSASPNTSFSLPLSDPQHMTCCYSFVRSERGPSTACS